MSNKIEVEFNPASTSSSYGSSNTDQEGVVLDVTEVAWKYDLEVGDLIDCKEKSNIWYQVEHLLPS